jgi:hypothetical protein
LVNHPEAVAMRLQLALTFVLLLVSGCSGSTPPIARGLPTTFGKITAAFDARMHERFPVGSDERALVAELKRERFKFASEAGGSEQHKFSAVYEAKDLACKQRWAVYWTASQQKITTISGEYGQVCL